MTQIVHARKLGPGPMEDKSVDTRDRFEDMGDLEKQVKHLKKARQRDHDYHCSLVQCLKGEHKDETRIIRRQFREMYAEKEALRDQNKKLRKRVRKLEEKSTPQRK